MRRFGYILLRIASDLVSLGSRATNAFVYGCTPLKRGRLPQHGADPVRRCHLEAPHSPGWARRRCFVNALFFQQEYHCRKAWGDDVTSARYVLSLLKGMAA